MAKEKKEVVEEEVESPARAAFRRLMEIYKKQNPVKFAQKEKAGEWERKLAALK